MNPQLQILSPSQLEGWLGTPIPQPIALPEKAKQPIVVSPIDQIVIQSSRKDDPAGITVDDENVTKQSCSYVKRALKDWIDMLPNYNVRVVQRKHIEKDVTDLFI
jgi:hypothetical protein